MGDYLRKARLERKLSQPKVAKILKVSDETILSWEKNNTEPTPKDASKIIKFIGYFPFEWEYENLHVKVKYARMISGHNLEDMAKKIGCDPSALSRKRLTNGKTQSHTLKKIDNYLLKYLS